MIIPSISSTAPKQKESSFDALDVECPATDNILTAEIAMVGECPGDIDVLKGEPFMDQAGSQLNRICAAVRIARYKIYLTTACKAHFPKNNHQRRRKRANYRVGVHTRQSLPRCTHDPSRPHACRL